MFSLQPQTGVQDYETFNGQLDSLGHWIVEAEEALKVQDPNGSTDLTLVQDRMEELKVLVMLYLKKTKTKHFSSYSQTCTYNIFDSSILLQRLMLKFSSMAPELERLNELGYRLPLNDSEIKRMQNLNRSWSTASAQTTERFRYDS